MTITSEAVKQLRERSGAGMMDCKKALQETGGDAEKALDYLRKMGMAAASKRAHRQAAMGRIESYIHPGEQIGVLVEVNSETDFVAKTDDFKTFCHEIAMHIAAARPLAVGEADLDPAAVAREREVLLEQIKQSGKPESLWEKILDGRMKKFHEEVCLLRQPWVKDGDRTIEELRKELSGKVGENIVIRRFAVFQVGQSG
ncbi:MAG: translation elongation factor Ts [Candidatus Eisenbacteria bacterium]|uniref:Elongation factor Ts n=1 Tax=Eiseniibacteriota bacterium TaxID=2212470 RepID=A0A938BRM0_UNCEI|nr:translation elongation factor Ts [Candidatus Eisenbacteria bacterium]